MHHGVRACVGPGDLVLCVNASPNHVTGEPVPLVAGEAYRVLMVMDFMCPCGRSDALLDIGIRIRSAEESVAMMSGGERQSIAIGRAVYFGKP